MDRIKVLDRELSNMIAAGEVVERPASVVKELVENSIDAIADKIIVEIKSGGKSYIRVTDNGIGMNIREARKAFLCHATSKISTKDDLFNIKTMGFRGEAIPAIASVSKMELLTYNGEEQFGHRFVFDAGEEIYYEEVGLSKGTTFIVKDLFYNVPARLKFMKKDSTETANIVSVMNKFAIGHSNISFQLIVDGKEMLNTSKNSQFLDIVYSIYGKEVSDNLLPIMADDFGVRVEGYVSRPRCCRANRNYQLFYVNDRFVKNKTIIAAIDRAYNSRMMTGKHPIAIIKLYIPHNSVDVNVHPTKSEIKFSNDQKIFDSVYYAVNTALNNENAFDMGISPDKIASKNSEDLYKDAVDEYYSSFEKTGINIIDKDVIPETFFDATLEGKKDDFMENKHESMPGFSFSSLTTPGITLDGNVAALDVTKTPYSIEYADITKKEPEDYFINSPQKASSKDYFSDDFVSPSTNEFEISFNDISPDVFGEESSEIKNIFAPATSENNVQHISRFTELSNQDLSYEYALSLDEMKMPLFEAPDTFNYIGELFKTYIIVEHGNDFYLIDKHAAHEKIIYDKIKNAYEKSERYSQTLITPITVSLTPQEFATAFEHKDEINKIGFEFEEFGRMEILLRMIPFMTDTKDTVSIFIEIIEMLNSNKKIELTEFEEKALKMFSCKAAIKAGFETSKQELKKFAEYLILTGNINYCPHGRPVICRFTKHSIEKAFKRIV